MSAGQLSSEVSGRYARALIELAEGKNALPAIEQNLADFSALIGRSPELRLVLDTPVLTARQQIEALQPLLKKAGFHKFSVNFICLLAQNRRLGQVRNILKAFQAELDKQRGKIIVKVETAKALPADQARVLTESLSREMGGDIELNQSVRPEILGGMILTIGSRMIDDSVARKLERLRLRMGCHANENTGTLEEAV